MNDEPRAEEVFRAIWDELTPEEQGQLRDLLEIIKLRRRDRRRVARDR